MKVKNKKVLITIIAILAAIIVAIVGVVFIVNMVKMSGRQTYASENQMREAMQGIWWYDGFYDDENNNTYEPADKFDCEIRYEIAGDELIYYSNTDAEPYIEHIIWDPSHGSFTTISIDDMDSLGLSGYSDYGNPLSNIIGNTVYNICILFSAPDLSYDADELKDLFTIIVEKGGNAFTYNNLRYTREKRSFN